MPISIVAQAALVSLWTATLPFWFYSAEWGDYPAAFIAGLVVLILLFVPGKPKRPRRTIPRRTALRVFSQGPMRGLLNGRCATGQCGMTYASALAALTINEGISHKAAESRRPW